MQNREPSFTVPNELIASATGLMASNVQTREPLNLVITALPEFEEKESIQSLFSMSNELIAYATDSSVKIYDIRHRRVVKERALAVEWTAQLRSGALFFCHRQTQSNSEYRLSPLSYHLL